MAAWNLGNNMGDFEGGAATFRPDNQQTGTTGQRRRNTEGTGRRTQVVMTRQQLDSKRVRAGQSSSALPFRKDAAPGPASLLKHRAGGVILSSRHWHHVSPNAREHVRNSCD